MEHKKSLIFANVMLAGIAIILILAIFYVLYKSYTFKAPIHLNLIVLLTGGLLFSIITFYMRDNWKINIVIVVFSLLLSCYTMELICQLGIDFKIGKFIDRRSKYEVFEDFRTGGADTWPVIMTAEFKESNGHVFSNKRIFPLAGISNKTVVHCNESGQYSILENDEYGFNNPRGLYKKGSVKAVLLGDSFVHGACVNSGEDITSHLRAMGYSSLNLGRSGFGPLLELGALKEYAEPIQPEIVLWVYFEGNDLRDLKKEQRVSMIKRYLEDDYSQNLLELQREIDAMLKQYVNSESNRYKERIQKPGNFQNIIRVIKLRNLRETMGLLNKKGKEQKPKLIPEITLKDPPLTLFAEIMAIANRRVNSWGGKLYFVYLSGLKRFVSDNNYGNNYYRKDVLSIIKKIGIPIIDFNLVIMNHPDPLSLAPSFHVGHYNSDGYKLIAEFISSHLTKNKQIFEGQNSIVNH